MYSLQTKSVRVDLKMFRRHKIRCTLCSIDTRDANEYIRHVRKVHGNDRFFGTDCPLCDSKFVYSNIKSFIHHLRTHSSENTSTEEILSSFSSRFEENFARELIDQEVGQVSIISEQVFEQLYDLDELKKLYVKMLLKIREAHVLPGHVMKTMASSITGLFQIFFDCLSSRMNLSMNAIESCSLNDEIEKFFFDISRNEESFISHCRMYFKLVKPKEVLLPTGNKSYYVPIRELLDNLFQMKDFRQCITAEKKLIAEFDGQDIIYHYRNAEIGRQNRLLNEHNDSFLLQLYSDDLGVVNPLMGKNTEHKLSTFYFSVDDLPASKNSSLSAVHLLLLCYKEDLKDPKTREVLFSELKQDLISLETDGLILSGDDTRTYFTMSTFCADNLAGNFFSNI